LSLQGRWLWKRDDLYIIKLHAGALAERHVEKPALQPIIVRLGNDCAVDQEPEMAASRLRSDGISAIGLQRRRRAGQDSEPTALFFAVSHNQLAVKGIVSSEIFAISQILTLF
jgi:hypothetical protein